MEVEQNFPARIHTRIKHPKKLSVGSPHDSMQTKFAEDNLRQKRGPGTTTSPFFRSDAHRPSALRIGHGKIAAMLVGFETQASAVAARLLRDDNRDVYGRNYDYRSRYYDAKFALLCPIFKAKSG